LKYSHNTGEIEVKHVSFCPGKWQYSTYDEGGRKLTDEDSETNSITTYKYDDNDRVVKQILTDREGNKYETTFEYNKQGKLVRSTNYSGIVNETVYDEKGREIRSIIYNKDDPTSKFYSENKRDDNGNITSEIDESGQYDSTKYLYEDNTALRVAAKQVTFSINTATTTCTERQTMNLVGLTTTTAKKFYFWTSFAVRSKSRKYWTTWTDSLYEYTDGTLTAWLAMIRCISFLIYRLQSNTPKYNSPSLQRGRRSYGVLRRYIILI